MGNAYLEAKGGELEDELEGEHRCEDHIEAVEEVGVSLRLLVKLHR